MFPSSPPPQGAAQEYRSGTANTYAYGNYIDDRIATKNGSGTYYFHRSYNQTTEAVTDATGELVERYTATSPYGGYVIHDASGNALTVSSIGNRSVFQGAPLTDNVSGMVYLRNRWYSPEMGRFVSRDPAKDGWNWYGFVGKPQYESDPFGLANSQVNSEQDIMKNLWWDLVSSHIPNSLGKDLYYHYLWGNGSPFRLSFSDIDFLSPEGSLAKGNQGLRQYVGKKCRRNTVSIHKVSESFAGKSGAQIQNDGLSRQATLGNYTITLNGELDCKCEEWSFVGKLEIKDYWDFDYRWLNFLGIGERGPVNELKVLGMSFSPGMPFDVYGEKPYSTSGDILK